MKCHDLSDLHKSRTKILHNQTKFFRTDAMCDIMFRSTEIISLNLELFVPFSFSLISVFSRCLSDTFLFFPVFLADRPKIIVTFFFLEKAEKPLFGSFSDIFTLLLYLPQLLLHLPLYFLHPPLLLPNLRLTLSP